MIGCYHLVCRKAHYDYVTHLIELSGSGDLTYDFVRQEADKFHLSKLKPLITEKEGKDKEERSVGEAIEFYKTLGTKEAAERIAVLEPYTIYEGIYSEKGGENREVKIGLRNGEPYYSVYLWTYYTPIGEKIHKGFAGSSEEADAYLDTGDLTLTISRYMETDDAVYQSDGKFVSHKSERYKELLKDTWYHETQRIKTLPYKNYTGRVPFKGMKEGYIDRTVLGTHQEKKYSTGTYTEKTYTEYRWYDSTGSLAFIAKCTGGKVESVTTYGTYSLYYDSEGNPTSSKAPKNPKNEKIIQPHSYLNSSDKSGSSDPYDSDHYSDAEDFADEWEDEFEDWDEAWDYWQDRH